MAADTAKQVNALLRAVDNDIEFFTPLLTKQVTARLRAVDNDIARTGDVVKTIDKFFACLPIQERKKIISG